MRNSLKGGGLCTAGRIIGFMSMRMIFPLSYVPGALEKKKKRFPSFPTLTVTLPIKSCPGIWKDMSGTAFDEWSNDLQANARNNVVLSWASEAGSLNVIGWNSSPEENR